MHTFIKISLVLLTIGTVLVFASIGSSIKHNLRDARLEYCQRMESQSGMNIFFDDECYLVIGNDVFRITGMDDQLIKKFIEYELRYSIGRGHDEHATFAERSEKRHDALQFINSSWFDTCCLFVGYDSVNIRRVTLEATVQPIPEAQMPFQVIFEERA